MIPATNQVDLYLKFDYFEHNLQDLVQNNQVPPEAIQSIVYQLSDAIHSLHSKQVIHRDIKPDNIFVDDKFRVCLGDFGLARSISKELTDAIGTKGYKAPEVILGKQYSEAIDIWSLGCVVLFLVLGRSIFDARSIGEQLQKIAVALGKPKGWVMVDAKDKGNLDSLLLGQDKALVDFLK